MENEAIKLLLKEGKKDEAIQIVRKMHHNVTLKEADEYLDSLIIKEGKKSKKEKTKIDTIKIVLIALPIILFSLIITGIYQSYQYEKEISETFNNWHKDVYGPSNYQEAYLHISNDPSLTPTEISELYMKLRKLENSGVPFKETSYWKNYKLK